MFSTVLTGARTHNLRSVSVRLEPGQLVALTGVSGSGKSSLALDTLYAEGQRRFVESFSPYARQFLERLARPPIDRLEPVPAAIAVDRQAPVKSSRSTLATMADLEPYLAGLFLREALPLCPEHGVPGEVLDAPRAFERLLREAPEGRYLVTCRHPLQGTEQYLGLRDSWLEQGYRRLYVSGKVQDLDQVAPSHLGDHADLVLDRLRLDPGLQSRWVAALEQAFSRGQGLAIVVAEEPTRTTALELRHGLGCPVCARPLSPPSAGLFSYESPLGACSTCRGFGRVLGIDLSKVIPDHTKTLAKGAIRPWSGQSTTWERSELKGLCGRHAVPMDVPVAELTPAQFQILLKGDKKFPGIEGWFAWLEGRTYKMHVRVLLSRYRSYDLCPSCHGSRLSPQSLRFTVGGRNLASWHELEVSEARAALQSLTCRSPQGMLARDELLSRLSYLDKVGLGYLALNRQSRTLSGGEAQRVTLTAALGTELHSALFVLDEPSIGLHVSDLVPLAEAFTQLCERSNTVVLIEHEPGLIAQADRVIELGPGAGPEGGRITFDGPPTERPTTNGADRSARDGLGPAPVNTSPRTARGHLRIEGAREHNLRSVTVDVPLGVVCAVCGPSGSGKSTLVKDVLYRSLARRFGDLDVELPGAHEALLGAEALTQVVLVDQSPLGRTSRGNAATYTKAWDGIRKLFAAEPAAEAAGLTASHFSFNVDVGRCDACKGEGFETVEMQFLADVHLECPVCRGQRFKPEVLAIRHRGLNIADVLATTVKDAIALFEKSPGITRPLRPLAALGLGYLPLGQPLSTLSGGEGQRLKLCRSLGDKPEGTLWILDEPSAGLHPNEIALVLKACRELCAAGGSVVLVEHDLSLIAQADWVIELGPSGGRGGGKVLHVGPPDVIREGQTKTGEALRGNPAAGRARRVAPAMGKAALRVTGAREHNLKNVSAELPHGQLTVVTGPSGSGKSTLAFDVIFAEGQRRFLETLTPYARQFLPTLPRPDVDRVTGVPPAISLEQRTARAGSKSTVATVTEVSHFLRLLYAKIGTVHCPEHDLPVRPQTPEELLQRLQGEKQPFDLCAPVVRRRKGTHLEVFNQAARAGIAWAFTDGARCSTDKPPKLHRTRLHDVSLIVAEAIAPGALGPAELASALELGGGQIEVRRGDDITALSTLGGCPACGFSDADLDPRRFSFNTEQGRCATCEGEGFTATAQPVRAKKKRGRAATKSKAAPASEAPVGSLDEGERTACEACQGTRLAPLPRAVRLGSLRFDAASSLSVGAARRHFQALRLEGRASTIGEDLRRELCRRLDFLSDVGLDYLGLERAAQTLSGGEMQRLRLAAQLGAGLTGALYVLDEPSIGLHPRDTERLLGNLRRLVALGSTVLVVEHDEDTIRAADHLIDLGPSGGRGGGHILAQGPTSQVLAHPASPTARILRETPELRARLPMREHPEWLTLEGATAHNLRAVTARVPVGRLTVVAGVSGSGKSTLVRKVLLPAVRQALDLTTAPPGHFERLHGHERLRRAISVDQSPIGRSPRSVPATFLGIWDEIRKLYAATSDAQVLGFDARRFSFNSAGGRCEACAGQGVITHEMSFLPDVVESCPTCQGQRFEPTTLGVRYRGLTIGDVLALPADKAAEVFENHPKIAQPLRTLTDLGTGYVTLGQGSHTLSGGEAQRLKLAEELTAKARHEPTLYVLDEPTTGLHLGDVTRLIDVLGRLVQRGDTLVVIEHHPWVMAAADWLIELGPEAGDAGGTLVASGTPSDVARQRTATGAVLAKLTRLIDRAPSTGAAAGAAMTC